MKRTVLVAVLAVMFAMAPAVTASVGAQEVNAASTGSVHFVNAAIPVSSIDVCDGVTTIATNIAAGDGVSVDLSEGLHAFAYATSGNTCTSGQITVVGDGKVTGGVDQTVILGPGTAATAGINDTSPTPTGQARFMVRSNGTLGPVGVCLDNTPVATAGTPNVPITSPPAGGQSATATVVGKPYTVTVFLGGACQPGGKVATIAPCASYVYNVFATATAADIDTEVFTGVGCELPATSQTVSAFCTVLNPDLQAIQTQIKTLFSTVVVGTASTYPSYASIQALVAQINKATAAGDASVPNTIDPQWQIASSGLKQLATALTAAGFDLSSELLSNASVQQIVDAALGTGKPDPEVTAATTVLTDWYLANCAAVSAVRFTG